MFRSNEYNQPHPDRVGSYNMRGYSEKNISSVQLTIV